MKPCLPYRGQRVAIGATGRVDVGDHLGACRGDVLPAGVDGLQEGQIALGVNGGYGIQPMVVRRQHGQAKRGYPFQQGVDPHGLFWARLGRTRRQKELGIMGALAGVVKGDHARSFKDVPSRIIMV